MIYPDLREISLERNDVVPLISSIKEPRAGMLSIGDFLLQYSKYECPVTGRPVGMAVTRVVGGYFTILKAIIWSFSSVLYPPENPLMDWKGFAVTSPS
jgi:hypothetical protein